MSLADKQEQRERREAERLVDGMMADMRDLYPMTDAEFQKTRQEFLAEVLPEQFGAKQSEVPPRE